jgi:hypothetical protein
MAVKASGLARNARMPAGRILKCRFDVLHLRRRIAEPQGHDHANCASGAALYNVVRRGRRPHPARAQVPTYFSRYSVLNLPVPLS